MVKKSLLAAVVAAGLAVPSLAMASGSPQAMPEAWQPAMLVLQSDTAAVTSTADGQTIAMQGVHPLVSMTSGLNDQRMFDSAPVGDFDVHFNACNDMKQANGWGHPDGANALLAYADGPDNGTAGQFLQHLPLVTNALADKDARVGDTGAGSIPLYVGGAVFSDADQSLKFQLVEGATLADGDYTQVTLMAECLRR